MTLGGPAGSVLYPYGFGVGDATTPHEDDGMSPEIPLSEPFSFYGQPYKSLYVSPGPIKSMGWGVPWGWGHRDLGSSGLGPP